jgi:hypothetical protein
MMLLALVVAFILGFMASVILLWSHIVTVRHEMATLMLLPKEKWPDWFWSELVVAENRMKQRRQNAIDGKLEE